MPVLGNPLASRKPDEGGKPETSLEVAQWRAEPYNKIVDELADLQMNAVALNTAINQASETSICPGQQPSRGQCAIGFRNYP